MKKPFEFFACFIQKQKKHNYALNITLCFKRQSLLLFFNNFEA